VNKRQEQHIQGVIYGDYARQKNIWNFFISFFEKSSDENKRERRDRQNFMNFLRACYADVLKQSLQGTVLIELGLHTRPDALDPRAQLTFRRLNQVEQILPPDTSVVDVYDGAAGGLLILGEPGSGKSTLLVHLAQSLLIRAEQEELPEPPVILNLASWAQKRQPMEE